MSKEGAKRVLQQRIQKDLALIYKMICAMLYYVHISFSENQDNKIESLVIELIT